MSKSQRADGELPQSERVTFDFEGVQMMARRGETVAAALTAAGHYALRHTQLGDARGLYCGMGVCQECLVQVDGRSAERACMTKVKAGMHLHRQSARSALEVPAGFSPQPGGSLSPDILVIGGGAAGLNAAIAAKRAGADVLLVDERPQPGGQFYKQPITGIATDDQFAAGVRLIGEAKSIGITWMNEAQIWGAFEPFDFMISAGGMSLICQPRKVIIATGAYERPHPIPGWTLPGVMTTGAAQTLLRSYRVLAGRRILIAGNGPLNLQVACELARAGAEIVAIAELASRPGIRSLPILAKMALNDRALVRKGASYLAEIRRRRIPLHYGHVLASISGTAGRLEARLAPWAATEAAERVYEADAVCMGYGFLPSDELLRLLGCAQAWDSKRQHLATLKDDDCLTSIPNVYAAGDCTGLGGAPAAEAEGTLAGAAAARSLGFTADASRVEAARSALAGHRKFQQALWALFAAPPVSLALARPDTIICRCEELMLADVRAAFEAGAQLPNAIKRMTRAGMGRCQGRYCGVLLRELAGGEAGFTARPPVKPIRISEIA